MLCARLTDESVARWFDIRSSKAELRKTGPPSHQINLGAGQFAYAMIDLVAGRTIPL